MTDPTTDPTSDSKDGPTSETPVPASPIDWRPTLAQWVAGVVGLGLGLGSAGSGVPVPVAIAFPPSYAIACAAIARFRGIAAHGRRDWFVSHQVAMGVIVAGWLVAAEPASAAFNASWLVGAWLWWRRARATA